MMRWKTTFSLTICALALGCGDDDSPAGDDTAEQASTEGTEGGDASGTEGPEHDDRPPVLDGFTVDGSTAPPLLDEPAFVELSVLAIDDIRLDTVEFLDGDAVLAKLEAPSGQTSFSHRWLVSGAEFDGSHQLSVRAVDLAGNVAEASPIELHVDQPTAGLRRWSVTKDHGAGDFAYACALLEGGRLLVGGAALPEIGYSPAARAETFSTTDGSAAGEWDLPKIADARLRAIDRIPNQAAELVLAGTMTKGFWLARHADAELQWWVPEQVGDAVHTLGGVAADLDRLHVGVIHASNGYVMTYDANGGRVDQRGFRDTAIRDIAVLPGGDLIVVGEQEGNIFLTRLASAGGSRWTEVIDGGHGHDEALAVSVGPGGRFAVAGSIRGDGTGSDTWLRVYDEDGLEQWTAEPHDEAGGDDVIHGVAMDPLGRVVVTGRVTTNPMLVPAEQGDIFVASYEADGKLRWMAPPTHGPEDRREHGRDVCIDEVGNIYVVGDIWGDHYDWWVVRHAP